MTSKRGNFYNQNVRKTAMKLFTQFNVNIKEFKALSIYLTKTMYQTPTCLQTGNPIQQMCYTQGCPHPICACQLTCHPNHQHHQTLHWPTLGLTIHKALDSKPTLTDISALQHQQKQIRIIKGMLDELYKKHVGCVTECRKRQQMRKLAVKMQRYLGSPREEGMTGDEVFRFIGMMEEDEVYFNRKLVDDAVGKRMKLFDDFLESIKARVDKYRKMEGEFRLPEELVFISSKIDLTTIFANKIEQFNTSITIKPQNENSEFYPIFLQNSLVNGQSFEIEIVQNAWNMFAIGTAPNNLKNCLNKFEDSSSICLTGWGSFHIEGTNVNLNLKPKNGDKIRVLLNGEYLQFLHNEKELCHAKIPINLKNKQLFPVCWIRSFSDSKGISRLRFSSSNQ